MVPSTTGRRLSVGGVSATVEIGIGCRALPCELMMTNWPVALEMGAALERLLCGKRLHPDDRLASCSVAGAAQCTHVDIL